MKNIKKISILLVLVMTLGAMAIGCSSNESKGEDVDKQEKETLIISTWGYNEDILKKNVFEPFEKKHNVDIVLEVGNNADRLNKIRMNKNSDVDIIYLASSYAIQGVKEGLFEEINRENIPNIENIYEIAKAPLGEKYGPAYTVNRTGIIYDTEATKEKVDSWSDLWRDEFKDNASIANITSTAGPAMVLAAAKKADVSIKDDYDKAFEELSKLKPNIVKTYSRSSDLVNMFTQGEIKIGVAQDFAYGRIKDALPSAEWVNPKEGAFANLNSVNIVKGSDNKELAEKFINFLLSEKVQKANALDKVDSPINVNVELTKEEAEGLTYGKDLINSLQTIDYEYINSVMSDWIDKWNREISK
ncbi:MAG: ABC transporter substrate-binding protein [Firmicutes bacterium]|nr:ABC transporter substrate-binding protein [Bacillota bacterium]